MNISIVKLYIAIYLFVASINQDSQLQLNWLTSEKRHDNCVTWEDDLTSVTITCRLQNLQPVNISSERTGINMYCSDLNKTFACTSPAHINSSILIHNQTVEIKIVVIKNKDLEKDRWVCSQGSKQLTTNVSYIDGIISDSSVNIRGKIHKDTNNDTAIIVECGSCRVPDGNYLELHINKKSNGSMWYNKDDKTCHYKGKKCQPSICNCSSFGNWYQLKIRLTKDIKEIACNMHFKDQIRGGQISITTHLKITEKGIIYGDSIYYMIVPNKNVSSPHYENETENETVKGTSESPVDRENKDRPKHEIPIIVGVSVSVVILMVIILIPIYTFFRFRRYYRNEDKDTSVELECREKIYNTFPMNDAEERNSLLGQNEECDTRETKSTEKGYGSCHLCKSSTARYKCLPCDDNVCNKCALIHTSSIATKSHPLCLINDVPGGLSLSRYCKVHSKEENTFCADHNIIVCEACSTIDHQYCKANVIDTSCQVDSVIKFEFLLDRQLDTVDDWIALLDYNRSCILNKINMLKPSLMEPTPANTLETAENMKADLCNELEPKYDKLLGLYESKKYEIQQQCSQLKELKSNLDFIKRLESRRTEFLFVYCIRSKNKYDTITTTIEELLTDLNEFRVKPSTTLSRSSLGRFQIEDDYYEKRNPKTSMFHDHRPLYAYKTFRTFENKEVFMPRRSINLKRKDF